MPAESPELRPLAAALASTAPSRSLRRALNLAFLGSPLLTLGMPFLTKEGAARPARTTGRDTPPHTPSPRAGALPHLVRQPRTAPRCGTLAPLRPRHPRTSHPRTLAPSHPRTLAPAPLRPSPPPLRPPPSLAAGCYAYGLAAGDGDGEVDSFSGPLRWLDFGSGQERGVRGAARERLLARDEVASRKAAEPAAGVGSSNAADE